MICELCSIETDFVFPVKIQRLHRSIHVCLDCADSINSKENQAKIKRLSE